MRIGFIVPSVHGGGAEFVARTWARTAASTGDVVYVFVTEEQEDSQSIEGVEIVRLAGRGLLARIRSMRRELRTRDLDVAVSLMPYWNILLLSASVLLRGLGTRVCISARNMEIAVRMAYGRRYFLIRFIGRRLYRRADRFIAISHPVAAEATALYGLDPKRVFVIPNPAMAKTKLVGNEGLDLDAAVEDAGPWWRNIIVPGRLVEQKRPGVALRVAARIQEEHYPLTVHFYGAGPLEQSLRAEALELGVRASFHGWVEDWFNDVPERSAILLCSLTEGFGNVLVEAAANGLPCVTSSKALGVADAVIPGVTGKLVSGDSVESYATGLLAIQKPVNRESITDWLAEFSPSVSFERLRAAILDE